MRQPAFNPMTRQPGPCRCGEAQAARAEERESPANPCCHICRVIRDANPEWTAEQVAKAGAVRWRELTRRANANRREAA